MLKLLQGAMFGALGSLGGQLIGMSGNNNASGGNNTSNYGTGPSSFDYRYKSDDLTGTLAGIMRTHGKKID